VRVGPYELGPKIGGGGMARVHLGHRVERKPGVPDEVALKLIRDELAAKDEYVVMFLDEAQILSRLDHPGIIRTYDYGVDDGSRYIAMELLLGRSLMDAWDACVSGGGRMPLDLAVHVCLAVARALDYAHDLTDAEGRPLHVVHRDVNPTNVFLTYDGDVKLIDFGLAKSATRSARSKEGIIKGKVPYLSPEQVLEEGVDRRTDLYALGATLWESTTGRRLFKRDTDLETIRAIQKAEIPDPRTFVEGLYPDELWEIERRALAKNPDDRYASAGELAHDLESFLEHRARADMRQTLAAWLEELFPGEAAKQRQWLSRAGKPDAPTTMFPPAPVAEAPPVVSARVRKRASEPDSEPPPPAEHADADARVDADADADARAHADADADADAHAPSPTKRKPRPDASQGLVTWLLFGMLAGGVVVALYALTR
jgi:serine/threonine-protein kinase